MQLAFGAGAFWGIPSGSNPTPARIALAQSVGLNFTSSVKAVYGSEQFPAAIGRGTMTIKGTAEMGALSMRTINSLFLNGAAQTGQTAYADSESGSIPASSSYTVTVANSATFTLDLGVRYAATAKQMTRVASSPAQGQYSVSAGVYTFASADASTAVKIDYAYTVTSGETITLSNQPLGAQNFFQAVMGRLFNGKQEVITLNRCLMDSYDESTVLEDFMKPKLTFMASADDSDTLGAISMAEYN